jgi:hypothetical protein
VSFFVNLVVGFFLGLMYAMMLPILVAGMSQFGGFYGRSLDPSEMPIGIRCLQRFFTLSSGSYWWPYTTWLHGWSAAWRCDSNLRRQDLSARRRVRSRRTRRPIMRH